MASTASPIPVPLAGFDIASSSSTCSVAPIATDSSSASSACKLDLNYGCYKGERRMWVVAPCKGLFLCDGFELLCKSSRASEKPGRRHDCRCYEYEARPRDGGQAAVGLIPPELTKQRLVEKHIRQPRFVPNGTDEVMHSIFTFWNVLDRIMLLSSRSNYQTGYVREVQVRRMVQLVSAPGVQTYCEVGMNGGHSASAMLLANPSLVVHSFDLMFWNYSAPVVHMLSTAFGERFISHPGNSRTTVPEWTAIATSATTTPPRRPPCDMILVDGDHSLQGATIDLQNFKPLAAPGAPVIVDDIATDPGGALRSLERSGTLLVREMYGPYDAPSRHNRCLRTVNRGQMCLPWGFSVAEYK